MVRSSPPILSNMPASRTLPAKRVRGARGADAEFRIAAIDVGSNSIHMVIAQADADGGLTTLWRLKEMVGLGRISFPSRRLTYDAMDRAVETLRRFQDEAQRRQCERVVAVATSAVREAENGGDFVQRTRRELGLHVRVISARDEARLIYLGVRHEMDLKGGPHLIFDVGGGSVEFVVGDAEKPLMLESRKLGAARMTAKFVKSDPIDGDELKALLSHYDQELAPIVDAIKSHKIAGAVGTSGTIETLAAMCGDEEGSNGDATVYISASALAKLVSDLLESRSKDRAKLKGLDDDRKDQILAGALLVNRLFELLEIKRMQVCGSALREGLLIDFLARHRPEMQIRREVPDPRRRSVIDLARRCNWQQAHSEQVARLCVRLFDQTKAIHGLGRPQRELIEYGALLHDIGWLVGRKKHHKHSKYLILNGHLDPFSAREVKVMGHIARYHRKAFPKASQRGYRKLREKDRKIVRVGAALLRIADGLDRSNSAVITDLRCRVGERKVDIVVKAKGDAELEIWSARSRSRLFAKVFERTVGCQQE
jgi:exopolyphosphatase/guanosine-5'-triphosphate,3'-diphosphate pyrophosphatase